MHFVKINLRSGVFFSRADKARGKKKIRKGIIWRGHDLRLCQDLSNAPITSKLQHPPLGKPRIFDHHLQTGSGEFDLCLRRVGNLNRGCQAKLVFKVCLGISSGASLWFADILYSFEA